MARQFSLPAQLRPISLLPAAADAAGRTGAYRSLKDTHKAWIIARVNQGNAAQVTLTPLQAQDVSGTGAKLIPAVSIWANQDTSVSDALVMQAAAANFQVSATLKDKIVIFEIDPSNLDVNNGFDCIALQTSASNTANITSASLHILSRYQQASPPTSYAN